MPQISLEKVKKCYQCGMCTGICPLRYVSKFSPREIIYDVDLHASEVWDCLTCNQCYAVCPQGVNFSDFVLDARRLELAPAEERITHHSVFSLVNKLMTFSDKGIPTDFEGNTDNKSDVGYFPGCIDYFDLFLDVGVNFHEIGTSSIKLLNKTGIVPRIVDMKCCGHDALYQGDFDTFKKLSSFNIKKLEGLKTLVVSCAECYMTLRKHYNLPLQVLHISQLEGLKKLEFQKNEQKVAFHDPCRLGRFMGEYEAPRNVIKRAANLVEMRHARRMAQCCGVSAWMNCNDMSKALRINRLEEAKDCGANELITACTKCLTHLNCLKKERTDETLSITDFAVFMAGWLK